MEPPELGRQSTVFFLGRLWHRITQHSGTRPSMGETRKGRKLRSEIVVVQVASGLRGLGNAAPRTGRVEGLPQGIAAHC